MSWPYLMMPTLKLLKWLFAILNLYYHAKNQFTLPDHFWDTINFSVPWPGWLHSFFDHAHPNKFWWNFKFWICIDMLKNQFAPYVHSLDTVNFNVTSLDWTHPFRPSSPKNFSIMLTQVCVNLYQHTKNWLIPSVHSWDTVTFSHIHFWPHPTNKKSINFWFLQICINIAKIRLFHRFVLEKWLI